MLYRPPELRDWKPLGGCALVAVTLYALACLVTTFLMYQGRERATRSMEEICNAIRQHNLSVCVSRGLMTQDSYDKLQSQIGDVTQFRSIRYDNVTCQVSGLLCIEELRWQTRGSKTQAHRVDLYFYRSQCCHLEISPARAEGLGR